MAPKATLTNMNQLMIVGDVDGGPRIKNGEHAGIVESCSVCGDVLDLEAETRSVSTGVLWVTRRVVCLGAVERRARASGVGNDEAVLGESVQDSTRIVEELESPVTGVDDGCCNLQVLQPLTLMSGVEVLRVRLGVAETEATEAMRVTREPHRE